MLLWRFIARAMKRYVNQSGNSGVTAYEHGRDWIKVRFQDERIYEYTAKGVGRKHLKEMKRLADAGSGLSAYISEHPEVRDGYER